MISPDDLLVMSEYQPALIGIVCRCGQAPFAVYDRALLLDLMMAEGASYEQASEHLTYNIEGAWVGPSTPGILHKIEDEHDL